MTDDGIHGRPSAVVGRASFAPSLTVGSPPLFLNGVIELVGEFWIKLFKDRKLSGHAVLVIKTGINQSETVVRRDIIRLERHCLLQHVIASAGLPVLS